MTAFTTEKIDVEPWFDMELFMGVSQETRLGGDVMERFMALWKNWLPHLTVKGIDTGKIKYLLVALDEAVEQDVDKAWESSPSNAFLYNALAQTMCMAAVHAVIPEVQDAGCAPAPKPTAALREALEAEGIPYSNDKDPILSRRYAVVTHYPFKGGCEICVLQSNCPKGQGQMEAASVVLPGYEHPQQMCLDVGMLGVGKGNLSGERYPFPSPKPPPLSLQRLSTGGEAARREFV